MSSVVTKHIFKYPTALRGSNLFNFPRQNCTHFDLNKLITSINIQCRDFNSIIRHSSYSKNDVSFLGLTNKIVQSSTHVSSRQMSSNDDQEIDLPVLSDLPRRVFPNFMHYLRSLFFIHGLIVPYFDKEFSRNNFMDGAMKAIEVVSNSLSEGDFEALEPLVEKSCLDDIKRKLSFSTAKQREKLRVKAENIYGQFLYEVGIMFDETEEDVKKQRRWVEITFVAHAHPKFNDDLDDAVHVARNSVYNKGSVVKESVKHIQETIESNGGPVVLNYRFLREFTKGIDPSTTHWSISAINHFKLNEHNH